VKRIRKILYATDYSKASDRALEEAINLAKQNQAELLVVHVLEPIPYGGGEEFGGAELYRGWKMQPSKAQTLWPSSCAVCKDPKPKRASAQGPLTIK
jgi:hypothetical protein